MVVIKSEITNRKCPKCKAYDKETRKFIGMSFEVFYDEHYREHSGYVCHNCGFIREVFARREKQHEVH